MKRFNTTGTCFADKHYMVNIDERVQQIKKMGSITKLIGMMPGVDRKMLDKIDEADSEKKMKRTEAIIQS
ncbi:MAG: hypothetical protein J5631_07215, partial [Spirochaetaceae bacterium]|nr:hypothetical protein [Spirochaetaceae bacterium]